MPRKLLILTIIVMATLLVSVLKSRKGLWRNDNRLNIRMLTLRSVLVIFAIIIFLIFSLLR